MLVVGDRVRYRFQCTRDGTNPSNPLFADALQPDAGGLFLCTLLWHSEIAFTLLVNCFPQSGTMLIRFSSEKFAKICNRRNLLVRRYGLERAKRIRSAAR